jgi:endonuclease I
MKNPVFILLLIFGSYQVKSQCTAPNLPVRTSLILSTTDTQLSVYYDTTANAPATNINYLGILSTNPALGATPVNGTSYVSGNTIGTGEVIFYNKNYIQKKTGLVSGTTYYLFIYSARSACTGEPFYSVSSLDTFAITFTGSAGIPANYYDPVGGLTCSSLKTSLYNIIKPASGNPHPTYTGLWGAYYITDDRLNDAANKTIVWDTYTDNPTGAECEFSFGSPYQDKGSSGTVECQRYNREHAFPQSWFGGAVEPMRSDMFIVYPSDKFVNGQRGNIPYGVVTAPNYTSNNGSKRGPNIFLTQYTGTAFEPIDEYKGDLARSIFYVATAYENLIAGWQGNANANDVLNGSSYQTFDDWYLKLLYQWHLADPVSAKEIDRNNDVYMIQGTRNPYIDHPEYVALVWQCTGMLPVTITGFVAQKNNEAVLLKWYATQETNFKRYEIERSIDGNGFYKIGEVAGMNLAQYNFTDDMVPNASTVFYRLKMIDTDGQYRHSKTIAVRITPQTTDVQVFPNPAKDKLSIRLEQASIAPGNLLITDLSGRIILQQQTAAAQQLIELDVSRFPAGRYFIRYQQPSQVINRSFVVVK